MPSNSARLLAVLAVVVAGAATVSVGARVPQATFSDPLLLPGGGAEPSIRVPHDGQSTAYISAPTGLGSNFWRITMRHNADGTVTYVASRPQKPDLSTGGGDSEISVSDTSRNENRCDTIAYSGLHNADAFGNFTVATSNDCGKTFSIANPEGTQNVLDDRQWQAFDGAKTNFLIFHKVDTSQIVVTESIDGGQTYVSLDPDGAHGIIDAQTMPDVANNNQVGNIVVDRAHATGKNLLSGETSHRMYAVFGGPRDAVDEARANVDSNSGVYDHVDTIYLARSDDGGITWKDTKVFGVDPASHRELNMLFPVVSVDAAGNVYVCWSDGFKVQYAVSTDGGRTFSPAYQVNHDNRRLVPGTGAERPDAGRADLFPWIAAGANGLLDVVWYHGEGGSATSNLKYRDPGDRNTSWTVGFAQIGHAQTRHPRELTYSRAVTPTIHTGDICQNGTFCDLVTVPGTSVQAGDRSLLDFFQVAIDAQGRANVALADNDGRRGQNVSAFIQQLTGYSLTTGKPLAVRVASQ